MNKFTSFDISFAKTILQSSRAQVEQWSKDDSNPELSEACRMLLEAGK